MVDWIWVGIGGFAGAVCRYGSVTYLGKRFPSLVMPVGTLFVNLLGAFLLGLLTGLDANVQTILLLGTGFMGAFTTFSTFQYEMVQFSKQKRFGVAGQYLLLSVVLGLVLAYAGFELGKGL
ncbi:fluoride efflux transporter FluC [Paenibacillus physcomitrellae]|uniref:Fluoride-specific ion channel FluC n=1 Tax=Paenibacillus physcomitrellae TaxID=1619311 RepID=A0ABQ1GEY9_9BACL|nr:CrcB family protein [Paenibacillus physcomitrellae]GGA42418.1 chromosome condensation protein CrcB [Paenibacillus physcomitrellae]